MREPSVSYLSAIGLMSGTSYDGVDIALLNTDGESVGRLGPTGYRGYSDAERAVLRRAIAAAGNLGNRDARPEPLVEAEALLTAVHAEAVESYLAANGLSASDVAVVGFHGQTVLHQPDRHLTVQLGDGAALARRLGIPVVYDFRAADIAAGGEGAPLVSVFHRAMVRMLDRPQPVGVLNIGGVTNITYHRRRGAARVRRRPGQCADRRFHPAAHRRAARCRRRQGGGGKRRCGVGRARDGASLFRAAAAEIARPQRVPPLGRGGGRAREKERRGRRRDADRDHRRRHRLGAIAAATGARELRSRPAAAHAIRP